MELQSASLSSCITLSGSLTNGFPALYAGRYEAGVRRFEFDAHLAPYNLHGLRAWHELSKHITAQHVVRISPVCGNISIMAEAHDEVRCMSLLSLFPCGCLACASLVCTTRHAVGGKRAQLLV